MTNNNIKPFDYQEAQFFIGLELQFKRSGRRVYVFSVVDYGQGCVLDVRSVSEPKKRIGFYDKDKFFKSFGLVHFYP